MRKYTKITNHTKKRFTILLTLKRIIITIVIIIVVTIIIIICVIVVIVIVIIICIIQINDSILLILILSDQITDILVSLLKFHFIHTFAFIPMQESLSFVHFCKLCA